MPTFAQTHHKIAPIPKKINLFEQVKSPHKTQNLSERNGKPIENELVIVPKKVDLFAMNQTQIRTIGTIEPNKKVLAPYALPVSEYVNFQIPNYTDGIHFCGVQVPMNVTSVLTRLKMEFARCVRGKYSLEHYQQRALKYKPEIVQTLKENGLPEELFYLSVAESGLANVTSPKGAKGFWQFMPETARNYGLEVSATVDERLHPQKSCQAACRYLKFLYEKFHNWALAAAAYNMGEGGVENALKSQNKNDYFSLQLNAETAQYVYRIISLKYALNHPQSLGLKEIKKEFIPKTPFRTENVDYHIPDLQTFAEDCGTDLATLKAMNPWLISDRLDRKSGKMYEIRLPVEGTEGEEELLDR